MTSPSSTADRPRRGPLRLFERFRRSFRKARPPSPVSVFDFAEEDRKWPETRDREDSSTVRRGGENAIDVGEDYEEEAPFPAVEDGKIENEAADPVVATKETCEPDLSVAIPSPRDQILLAEAEEEAPIAKAEKLENEVTDTVVKTKETGRPGLSIEIPSSHDDIVPAETSETPLSFIHGETDVEQSTAIAASQQESMPSECRKSLDSPIQGGTTLQPVGLAPMEVPQNSQSDKDFSAAPNSRDDTKDPYEFFEGQSVSITGGSYAGRHGVVVKVTAKMVKIDIPDLKIQPRVTKKFVEPEISTVLQTGHASKAIPAIHTELKDAVVDSPRDSSDNTQSGKKDSTGDDRSEPSKEPAKEVRNVTSSSYPIDGIVRITGGKHSKHKMGRVVSETPKTLMIKVDELADPVRVYKTNVAQEIEYSHTPSSKSPRAWIARKSPRDGSRKSPKSSNDKVLLKSPRAGLGQWLGRNSPRSSDAGSVWRLPEIDGMAVTRFGNRRIEKLRVASAEARRSDRNFFTEVFHDRLMPVEIALNAQEVTQPFDSRIEKDGFTFELISAKVQSDGDVNGFKFSSAKCVRLLYALKASDRSQSDCSLQEELIKIADFASLTTQKAVARLELLQSPAYKFPNKKHGHGIYDSLNRSDFELLTNEGNDGCGFIAPAFLEKLCGENVAAKRTNSIQVRAVIPALGIFKGELMRKRIPKGQPQIQLVPSMKKVGASLSTEHHDHAFLWITQNGVSPSKNNEYIGRLLDPNARPPPKSFEPKPLSEMILRLWRALGVPEEVIKVYAQRTDFSRRKEKKKITDLQHAFVKGVADPTGAIPPGHVFVTGMKHMPREELFVTRSPCILPKDGRMFPHVTQKPDAMSEEDWEFLNGLSFGDIIFADALPGKKPIPHHISKGDLDGDLYFVCWNKEVLRHVQAEPIQDIPEDDAASSKTLSTSPGDNQWLEKAQQKMVDAATIQEQNELVGRLYCLSEKTANNHPEFMHHPDAQAFGGAYYEALDVGKHGGKVNLPSHLVAQLPKALQSMCM